MRWQASTPRQQTPGTGFVVQPASKRTPTSKHDFITPPRPRTSMSSVLRGTATREAIEERDRRPGGLIHMGSYFVRSVDPVPEFIARRTPPPGGA
jgi:hypothetical protein